jgi:c-di-GMP-binding flagellar brake protein YcgR
MDTRSAPRVAVKLRVISTIDKSMKDSVSLAGGNRFEARAYDISVGGIGLLTKYFLPKGLLLELEIEGIPFGLKERITAKGEVTYCKNIQVHKYRCGIRFTEMADQYTKAIAQFVSSYERRSAPRVSLSSDDEAKGK